MSYGNDGCIPGTWEHRKGSLTKFSELGRSEKVRERRGRESQETMMA